MYLRLPEDWNWDEISQELLNDCAQLTKANSIQGSKMDNITVIYTPWSNLLKTGDMADGQVGFKKDNLVKKIFVDTRINAIVNRLNKTKEEKFPDLRQEKLDYEKEQKHKESEVRRKREKEELQLARDRKQLALQRDHAYDDLFTDDNLRHSNNQDRGEDWEDDFM